MVNLNELVDKLNIQPNLGICIILSCIGGILEVIATAVLAILDAKQKQQKQVEEEEQAQQRLQAYKQKTLQARQQRQKKLSQCTPISTTSSSSSPHDNDHHDDEESGKGHHDDNKVKKRESNKTGNINWNSLLLIRTFTFLNILLQIVASIVGNLISTWYGPVSIVGPTFLSSQLVANMIIYGYVLGYEYFTKDMKIGTCIIITAALLLPIVGPTNTTTTTTEQQQKETITVTDPLVDDTTEIITSTNDTVSSLLDEYFTTKWYSYIWNIILLCSMLLSGIILLIRQFTNQRWFPLHKMSMKYTILLIARCTSFVLNLSFSKVFALQPTTTWIIASLIIKGISSLIMTGSIIIQSTEVSQNTFVPLNATLLILINAINGFIVWKDWFTVTSHLGYFTVFIQLIVGNYLLLGEIDWLGSDNIKYGRANLVRLISNAVVDIGTVGTTGAGGALVINTTTNDRDNNVHFIDEENPNQTTNAFGRISPSLSKLSNVTSSTTNSGVTNTSSSSSLSPPIMISGGSDGGGSRGGMDSFFRYDTSSSSYASAAVTPGQSSCTSTNNIIESYGSPKLHISKEIADAWMTGSGGRQQEQQQQQNATSISTSAATSINNGGDTTTLPVVPSTSIPLPHPPTRPRSLAKIPPPPPPPPSSQLPPKSGSMLPAIPRPGSLTNLPLQQVAGEGVAAGTTESLPNNDSEEREEACPLSSSLTTNDDVEISNDASASNDVMEPIVQAQPSMMSPSAPLTHRKGHSNMCRRSNTTGFLHQIENDSVVSASIESSGDRGSSGRAAGGASSSSVSLRSQSTGIVQNIDDVSKRRFVSFGNSASERRKQAWGQVYGINPTWLKQRSKQRYMEPIIERPHPNIGGRLFGDIEEE